MGVAGLLVALIGALIAVATPARPAQAAQSDVPAAIQAGVNDAARYGITQYVAIVDRSTGQLIGSTANLDQQVASESVFKLFLAAYLLRANGGAFPTSAMNSEMWDMIVRSNDAIASKYWTANAVPGIAAVYGLGNTTNPTDRVTHWGAVRITARDMATFMWRMSQDPLVAPWLMGAMASTAQYGADSEFQGFGFNSLSGTHGSKQGWGCDSYWVGPCAIQSVGYTDKIMGAVLQTGSSGTYNTMKSTSTTTTQLINNAANYNPPSLPGRDNPEGHFDATVRADGTIDVSGYAFDGSNLLATVDVFLYTNNQASYSANANGPRPELANYGIPGNHGFSGSFKALTTGTNQVCMYLRNVGPGSDQLAQCVDLNYPADPVRDDPRGAISATVNAAGTISVSGWAFDPSNLYSPVNVMVSNNGQVAAVVGATGPRPELAQYGVPGNHGFALSYAAPATGPQSICLYVANIGYGESQWVQCVNVTFAPDPVLINPRGAFAVSALAGGNLSIDGWAFDPSDLYSPVTIMITVNGEVKAFAAAQGARPELAQYGVPGNHGFATTAAGTAGKDSVCMFVFNIGYGENQLVGCQSV